MAIYGDGGYSLKFSYEHDREYMENTGYQHIFFFFS